MELKRVKDRWMLWFMLYQNNGWAKAYHMMGDWSGGELGGSALKLCPRDKRELMFAKPKLEKWGMQLLKWELMVKSS